MPLTIERNEFKQPDFTIWYTANDERRLAVGRIFRASGEPDVLWFWSVEIDQRAGRTPPHEGYEVDELAAMRAWKRCWQSADVPVNWPPLTG
jgi:hypothetical protein